MTHQVCKSVLGLVGFGSDDGGVHWPVVDELSIRRGAWWWSGSCASSSGVILVQ